MAFVRPTLPPAAIVMSRVQLRRVMMHSMHRPVTGIVI
jgi:hypothetical protein